MVKLAKAVIFMLLTPGINRSRFGYVALFRQPNPVRLPHLNVLPYEY